MVILSQFGHQRNLGKRRSVRKRFARVSAGDGSNEGATCVATVEVVRFRISIIAHEMLTLGPIKAFF